MNLTLYSVQAFLILDSEGHRVMAKYYPTRGADGTHIPPPPEFSTMKDQKHFEKGLWKKTKKASTDILHYSSHLVLFKQSLDLIFYVVASPAENELMLWTFLNSLMDCYALLLRNGVEKRSVLENLDLVCLALDEVVDDGIILDTDATALASRVSRPRPDTTEIVINEQTIMSAYQTVRERFKEGLGR